MADLPPTKESGTLPRAHEYDALRAGLRELGWRGDIADARCELVKKGIDSLVAERDALREALTRISEGGLGDEPWSANYDRIREVARAALERHS